MNKVKRRERRQLDTLILIVSSPDSYTCPQSIYLYIASVWDEQVGEKSSSSRLTARVKTYVYAISREAELPERV